MKITNIRQLLPLVEARPEFVVIDRGEYIVLDYVFQQADTFDEPALMECRGIKFDRDGLILARPFRKFFNYGEQGSGLPIHRPHIITEKLDGSMIHPVFFGKRMFLHTRKGHTDVAKKAERFVLSTPDIRYSNFCYQMQISGWTPIFEYIGPENRIVLRYDEERLVLLACRHTIEGHIMSYGTMEALAEHYNVPIIQPPGDMTRDTTIDHVNSFVEYARGLKDAEGFVVYFDDGYMVKIKAEDYVLKHRALDDMSSKKKIVALCAQGFMDDVLPTLDEPDRQELLDFNDAVQQEITEYVRIARSLYNAWGDDRKKFAVEVAPKVQPKWLAGVVFGMIDGRDPRKHVIDAVIKNPDNIYTKWRGQ